MGMIQQLDRIDHIILQRLIEDGRASFSSIAKETNLTDVAIKKRFESLKRKSVIRAVSADLNLKVLGFENPIFVQMRTEIAKNKDITKKLNEFDFVVDLYHVLGEYNLLCKIVVTDLDNAEKIINQIGVLDGVLDVKTMVVLSELKRSKALPAEAFQKRL